jgi:hypothetical protein
VSYTSILHIFIQNNSIGSLNYEATWLERAFEESEVFEVVKALNGDKAPSVDGFLFGFLLALLGGS